MNKKYESLVNEIRDCIINEKDYEKGIDLGQKLLKKLNKEKNKKILKEEYCVGYYHLALNSKKLADKTNDLEQQIDLYNNSVKYIIKSNEYTNRDQYDLQYIYNILLLANCYVKLNISEEAIKLYMECIKLYELVNLNRYKIATLFNICLLNKDVEGMQENIKLYIEFLDEKYDGIYNDDAQKINALNQMKEELQQTIDENTYTR